MTSPHGGDSSSGPPSLPNPRELDALRGKIDALDEELIRLLNRRAALVVEVGKLKRGTGIPIYAPHREAAILDRMMRLNQGPLSERTIEAIYRELMSGSFQLEQPLRIGYLGPEGSYSHVAAMEHFGSSVEFDNLRAIEGVFVEVAREHVDYGLVPIENSTGGGVSETMDAFTRHHHLLNVYAEVQLGVSRCLLANCEAAEVRRIHASPDGYSQARTWLATQYPQAAIVPQASSTEAIRIAKEETAVNPAAGVAAVGSALAGEIHGLHVLFQHIEDRPNEITRFLVLSRQRSKPSGDDKTSMMFTTPDRPGALVDMLSVFHHAGVNLTHIDKRPSGRVNWEYAFFIDAVGHRDDERFANVIEEARGHCKELTVLGSYPRSRRVL